MRRSLGLKHGDFRQASNRSGISRDGCFAGELDVVVPYTEWSVTDALLKRASPLPRVECRLTLVAVHTVPYAEPFGCRRGARPPGGATRGSCQPLPVPSTRRWCWREAATKVLSRPEPESIVLLALGTLVRTGKRSWPQPGSDGHKWYCCTSIGTTCLTLSTY